MVDYRLVNKFKFSLHFLENVKSKMFNFKRQQLDYQRIDFQI